VNGNRIVTYWGKQKEEVEKILGLPEGVGLIAILKFGVPGEEADPIRSRRPEFSWLHKNRFGNRGIEKIYLHWVR